MPETPIRELTALIDSTEPGATLEGDLRSAIERVFAAWETPVDSQRVDDALNNLVQP